MRNDFVDFFLKRRWRRGDPILPFDIFHSRFDLPQAKLLRLQRNESLEVMTNLHHHSFRLLWKKAAFSVRPPILLLIEMVNASTLSAFNRPLD